MIKGNRKKLASVLLCGTVVSPPIYAGPSGAVVVNGNVNFSRPNAKTLNITNSPQAIINWKSFSSNKDEIVRFMQQSSSSAVLNRVVGENPSNILGKIFSNGRVFLINPNGLVFGKDSVINTAGFVGSTLNITDQDFINKNYHFQSLPEGAGGIENLGIIKSLNDGNVILIAPNIENKGVIEVKDGNLILAAGEKVILTSWDEPDIRFEVQAEDNSITNLGKMLADNSAVKMFAGSLKHEGVVRANGISLDANGNVVISAQANVDIGKSAEIVADGVSGGKISIESNTGDVTVQGKISAQGTEGQGGEVVLSAKRVALTDSAVVDASGETGGGQIKIGGGLRGQDESIANAEQVLLSKNSSVKADAKTAGDGGDIVVWADKTAQVYGSLSAKGGAVSGNGGFIETSAKKYLELGDWIPQVTAVNGKAGTWLIDPEDVQITNTTANISQSGSGDPGPLGFVAASADLTTTIDVATINAALDAGSNVVIDTSGSGSANGDITVSSAIVKSADGGNADGSRLTLNAHNDININASITSSSGTLDILLNADQDSSGQGEINLGNVTLNGNGGTINASGKTLNIASGATIASDLTVGDLNLTGGTLSTDAALTVSDNFVFDGATITGSGSLSTGSSSTTLLADTNDAVVYGTFIWNNFGTINFAGENADYFILNNTSQLVNETGGVFNILSTDPGAYIYGAGMITNKGTLSKTATGKTDINTVFNNQGNVIMDNADGSIEFGASGTDTGTYTTANGSINFQSGTRTWDGASTSGSGNILLNGSTLHVAAGKSASMGNLTTSSGTLDIGGTLSISGNVIANGAIFRGDGDLSTETTSVTSIASVNNLNMYDTLVWTNHGTVNFDGVSSDYFIINNTAQFVNATDGVFNLNATSSSAYIYGAGSFTNQGTLSKTTAGTSDINTVFHNQGNVVIDHATGAIELGASGTDTGTYTTTNGSVNFSAGTRSWDGVSTSGNGNILLNGAMLYVGAGKSASIGNLTTSSGTVDIDGSLSINGNLIANGSIFRGDGSLSTTSSSTTSIANTSSVNMYDTLIWTNHGTANFDGVTSDYFIINNTAQFVNASDGVFNLNASSSTAYIYGAGSFTNQGTLSKTSIGNTDINTIFNNQGNVIMDNASGSIDLGAGGTDTGTYTTTNGSVNFSAGTRSWDGVSTSGNGNILLNGATLYVGAGKSASIGNLTTSSGTVDVDGSLSINGNLIANGSIFRGDGNLSTEASSVTSIANVNTVNMYDTLIWTNHGAASFDGVSGDYFIINNTAQFVNDTDGVLNLNATASNAYIYGAGSVTNKGSVTKSTTGTTDINSIFHNQGSVTINNASGAIQLGNSGTDTGTYVLTDGSVNFQAGSRTLSGVTATGDGHILLNGATLNIANATTSTISNLQTTSGTISTDGDLQIADSMSANGSIFRGTGNLITLSGSQTSLAGVSDITMYDSIIWTNHGTVNFDGQANDNFVLSNTTQFVNATDGVFNINSTEASAYMYGSGTFTNQGELAKASSGTTDINTIFHNQGNVTMNHATGAIELGGNGTDTGTYTLTAGSVNFQGGSRTLSGVTATGAGYLLLNGANVFLANGTTTTVDNFRATSGAVYTDGDLHIVDSLDAINAIFRGTGEMHTLVDSVSSMANGADVTLYDSIIWRNFGEINFDGQANDNLAINNTTQFINEASGLFNINSTDSTAYIYGAGTFTNKGELSKSSEGTTDINSIFHNQGNVTMNNALGAIELGGNGTDTGTYTVTSGSVNLQGGNRTWNSVDATGIGSVLLKGSVLTISTGTTSNINNLETTSGTIYSDGQLVINNSLIAEGSIFRGTGSLVTAVGTMNVLAANADQTMYDSLIWTNHGDVDFSGGLNDNFILNNASQFVNAATGLFNITSTDSTAYLLGAGTFTNQGTVSKSVAGHTDMNMIFHNQGNVEVNHPDAILEFGGNGTDTGTYTLSDGAVHFQSGTRNLNAGVNFVSGNGKLVVNGAIVNANAGSDMGIASTLQLSSGSLYLNSAGSPLIGQLDLLGGILYGSDNVTVTGGMTFDNSSIRETIQLTTNAGTVTSLADENDAALYNSAIWTNHGTVNFDGEASDIFSLNNTSQFINASDGTFNINATDVSATINGSGTFTNQGTLSKNTTGTSPISSVFHNQGTLEINNASGVIRIGSVGTDTGDYLLTSGAINFNAGSRSFDGVDISGSGLWQISGAAIDLSSSTSLSVENLQMTSGAIDGSGQLLITNSFGFTGSTIRGSTSLETANGSITTLAYVSDANISDTVIWTNHGTVNFNGQANDNLHINNTAQFINATDGVFNLNVTEGSAYVNGAGTFTNQGLLSKTTTGETLMNVIFHNQGSVVMNNAAGSLKFTKDGTDTSGYSLVNGDVNFSGGTRNFDGISLTGNGTVLFTGATINLNAGKQSSIDQLHMTAGTIQGDGDLLINNSFDVDAGTIRGNGELITSSSSNSTFATVSDVSMRDSRIWRNHGNIAYTGSTNDNLFLYDTSQLINEASGFFDLQTTDSTAFISGAGSITNYGTISKTNEGISKIASGFHNAGNVVMNNASGQIRISGSGTDTGSYSINAGTLQFDAGTRNFDAGSEVTGAGILNVSGSGVLNFTADSSLVLSDQVNMSGGTLNLGTGKPITFNHFNLTGGTVNLNDELDVSGSFVFNAATLQGDGTFQTLPGISTSLADTGYAILSGNIVWNNAGDVTYLGDANDNFTIGTGSNFVNLSGASFNLENTDASATITGAGTFTNQGSLNKFTAGTTSILSTFHNQSEVNGTGEMAAG